MEHGLYWMVADEHPMSPWRRFLLKLSCQHVPTIIRVTRTVSKKKETVAITDIPSAPAIPPEACRLSKWRFIPNLEAVLEC